MRNVLGFLLTEEQFEELAMYIDLGEIKRNLADKYDDEDYINVNIYDGQCIDSELVGKVFRFLHKALNIDKDTFIDSCIDWLKDDIDSRPFYDLVDYYASGIYTKEGVTYRICDYEVDPENNLIFFKCEDYDGDEDDPTFGYFYISEDADEVMDSALQFEINDIASAIQEAIDSYEEIGTHEQLTLEEKKKGLNNTLEIIRSAIKPLDNIPIKEKALDMLCILETKINSISTDGRARQLEELIKRIDAANVGYIMRDDKSQKIFYPIIADMLLFELKTLDYITEPFIQTLWSGYYQIMGSKKSKKIFEHLDERVKKAVIFLNYCKTTGRQRHYLASLFSKELKIIYKNIKKLIEHLFYQTPKNAKLPDKPMKNLPEPIINPFHYSYLIAS